MPLTKETITADDTLKGLTDDQIGALVTLSTNVEQKAIDDVTNRIHSDYDRDIERITGKKKEGSEKTYHLLQNVLTDLVEKSQGAGKAAELQTQLDALKAEKSALELRIKEGVTDAATKQRIADLEQKLSDKESEIKTVKTAFEQEKTQLQGKFTDLEQRTMTYELQTEANSYFAQNKINFKQSIPETVRLEIMAARQAQLLGEVKPDLIDDGQGGKRRVFRDGKGEILRNPANKLEPFTFAELYASKLADLIEGKGPGGGGTKPGEGSPGAFLDMASVKTQVDADEMIVEFLIKTEGLAKTNPKFSERQMEIRKAHAVEKLPLR